MKLAAPLCLLFATVSVFAASNSHLGGTRLMRRHARHARLAMHAKADGNGRCSPRRRHKLKNNVTTNFENVQAVKPFQPSNSEMLPPQTPRVIIDVQSSCGPTGATAETTATSGPNGDIDWLNCGLNDGGWQPSYLQVSDIVAKDLATVIFEDGSPFKPCISYLYLFEQYGAQFGVPPIVIAAIAMQESNCDATTVGGAGEQGLMQITPDKCAGAPDGNCMDPSFNVKTGVQFFATTLENNNGSLLTTIGNYNGWQVGMTYDMATAAANTACCRCQNNLDYLHHTLNGWAQNIDPYMTNPRMGKYFNLDTCFD